MIVSLLAAWSAFAVSEAEVMEAVACLDAQDVACAEAVLQRTGMARSDEPAALSMVANVAFHAGDYPRAYDAMAGAVERGAEDPFERLALYERTMYATAGWTEVERGRFRIRYRPGADAILVDEAADVLERTDRYVAPLIGGVTPGQTLVELFPDGRSFIAASSLTQDDVEATGVVALSKWTRLLVTSPRARGGGYDWRSTLSHEYIHLLVAAASQDRAPVWLQEAIAKYLDGRFESGGADNWRLSPMDQSNLARALAEDDLVPFEEMHPSLAKIKVLREDGSIDHAASARRSQTAYAQLASLLAFAFERAGEGMLVEVLEEVAGGAPVPQAFAEGAGYASIEALLVAWEQWLRGQELIDRRLAERPTVLDGGDEADADPMLSRRKDLARFVRLGDLLYAQDRYRAALVEYDKARPAPDDEEPPSPMLGSRVARTRIALGDLTGAQAELDAVLADYPDFTEAWRVTAVLELERGDVGHALEALERAIDFDPFHLASQTALLDLYKQVGSPEAGPQAARLSVLRRGGELGPLPVLHERYGEYELPRSPEAKADAAVDPRKGLVDSPAPPFSVTGLDGARIELDDLAGRVVLLDFWATWCGPCKAVMPALSALQEELGDRGLTVLGISDEASSKVRAFVVQEERKGRRFAQTLAVESGAARRAYHIRSIPSLFLIDRAGVVRLVHVGAGDMGEVRDKVLELLAE